MVDNTSFKLRLLHLSDLHERGSREQHESWRRRRVLGDAWLHNLDALKAAGPFDLVCFTGDAADWGLADEYAATTEFFQQTLQQLGVPLERFFLVPGNHDICRTVAADDWKTLRDHLHHANDQDISRWLAGGATPWGFQNAQRDALLTRQTAFRDWLRNDLKRPDLLPDPTIHPHLGYRQTVRLPRFPFDIHIIGLDSAWLAGDDHDAGKLRLTEDQVMRLTGDARGDVLGGFRLALIHHPLGDLADGAHCRRLLAERDRVNLLLRGHLHEPEPEEWADPNRRLRQVAAGCLYEGHGADRYPNACEVIEITLDAQGHPQRYELWFRGWSGRGFWFDDNSLYRGTQNGRLTWWIQTPPAPSTVHPRVEDVFAGRQTELAQLEPALLQANGGRPVAICSVQGMAGVGKSYLVDRFYALHKVQFPGGYLRLVLDPRQPLEAEALLGRLRDLLQLPAGADLSARLQQPLTLVHIENADSQETARVVAQAVQRLTDCPIAVSGRFQHLGENAGWLQIPLHPFEKNTALDQLSQELKLGKSATAEDYGALVQTLGYLPLAIHLAAGHLRAGRSVAGFLSLLRKKGLCLEHPDPADSNRLLSTTFELSLDLLQEQLGTDTDRLLPAFHALGHGPVSGFEASLGAALAGLNATDFEELTVQAHSLSLLDRTPEGKRWRWRLHPLLAELLRLSVEEAAVLKRMSDWFLERLPAGEAGREEHQGQRWDDIHQENAALVEWLTRVPKTDWVRVERAGSQFAIHNGPFDTWLAFCERSLQDNPADDEKSNILWTAGNVAQKAGLLDRALVLASQKVELDQSREAAREVVLAWGLKADIWQARGQLDEALRIRQEELLPVFERLGDVRERAVTLGKIADIWQDRGQLDEALRIRQEEELPVYERLQSVRDLLVCRANIGIYYL